MERSCLPPQHRATGLCSLTESLDLLCLQLKDQGRGAGSAQGL